MLSDQLGCGVASRHLLGICGFYEETVPTLAVASLFSSVPRAVLGARSSFGEYSGERVRVAVTPNTTHSLVPRAHRQRYGERRLCHGPMARGQARRPARWRRNPPDRASPRLSTQTLLALNTVLSRERVILRARPQSMTCPHMLSSCACAHVLNARAYYNYHYCLPREAQRGKWIGRGVEQRL